MQQNSAWEVGIFSASQIAHLLQAAWHLITVFTTGQNPEAAEPSPRPRVIFYKSILVRSFTYSSVFQVFFFCLHAFLPKFCMNFSSTQCSANPSFFQRLQYRLKYLEKSTNCGAPQCVIFSVLPELSHNKSINNYLAYYLCYCIRNKHKTKYLCNLNL
jgi:hypothetical protein